MKRILILILFTLSFLNLDAQQRQIKTFSILGDSYSTFYGYIPEGNASWYFTEPQGENDVISVEQTWWYLFASDGGYELLLNESYSGSTICNTGYDGADYKDRSFITRMLNLPASDSDLIIIFGGTNDSWANAPVGNLAFDSWTSGDLYSCLPACCFMLEYLTKVAPRSEVIFVINSELKDEITSGIIEACDHYGVHSLLLKDIEKKWGHPSIKGMKQINSQISDFVSTLK